MGPAPEGVEAIAKIAPQGWRYAPGNEHGEFIKAIADTEDVPEDHVAPYAGSSDPLHRVSCAFTSPSRSWTMANPGYGGGAPEFIGSKVNRVPLCSDYSHDVEAMIKADPNAGAYYVCNPNNPTGTLTPRKKIEYLLANKKPDAIVVVDEAYIHFSAFRAAVERLGSGWKRRRCAAHIFQDLRHGRPTRRFRHGPSRPAGEAASLRHWHAANHRSACATASLKVKSLVPERRARMKDVREDTFAYLEKKNIAYIPSEANFFMMEVNRPGMEFAKAMAANKVIIGRVWPAYPTKVRVTVGTQEEMTKFKAAVDKVMAA